MIRLHLGRVEATHIRRLTAVALGVVVAGMTLVPCRVAAQKNRDSITWGPGKRMTEAIAAVIGGAKRIADEGSLGFVSNGLCVSGAFLRVGGEVSMPVQLEADKTYAMIGGGDSTATDVDLTLEDPRGRVVEQDEDDDATPIVVHTCRATGVYRLKMRLHSSPASGSFCSFARLSTDGLDIPTNNLAVAAAQTILVGELLSREGLSLSFHEGRSEIALYGVVLDRGKQHTLRGIHFGAGRHVVVAGGDANAQDLDLTVTNENGRILGSDKDDDKTPRVILEGEATAAVQLQNVASNGKSLSFVGLLDVR